MCPFSIDDIHRESLEFSTGSRSYRWRIAINWPRGRLEFQASRFTQTLIGEPVIKAGAQSLSSEERSNAA